MDKPPPRRMLLKESHIVMQKFNKLCDLADEMGISLSFYGHGASISFLDKEYYIEDIEGDSHVVSSLPPCTEVKIVYDNPDYIAFRDKEDTERRKKQAEEKAVAEAKKEAEAQARLVAMEQQKERQEREQYAKLKEKYGA